MSIAAAAPVKDHLDAYREVVDVVLGGVPLARPESEFSAALAALHA